MRVVRLLVVTGLLLAGACAGGDSPGSAPAPTEPVTTVPTGTDPVDVPSSTTTSPPVTSGIAGAADVPATWFRYGADGLFLVDVDGEQRLIDRSVGWAAADGSGGILLTLWSPDRFGPTWWLAGGAIEPSLVSEFDDPVIAARLDGRPVAVDGWPAPDCDEGSTGDLSARDLITGDTTTLQCGVDAADSGNAPDSFGGGLFVGVEWNAVHPSGRSTAIRLVFRDTTGAVVDVPTNPFASDCSPCELAAALSPDGSTLAVVHRADAPPTRSDEYDAWLATTTEVDAELLVVDLASGDVLHRRTVPAGTRPAAGSWFDGRYVALDPDAFSFPWLAAGDDGDAVRTLQRLLVEQGAAIDVDGVFGPGTETAVEAFHVSRFGAERSTVGPDTWSELGVRSTIVDTVTGKETEVPGRVTLDVVFDVPAPTPAPTAEAVYGPPDPQLIAASPPGDIDWADVGPGWLIVDHGTMFTDPPTLDERGLYLVAPDDHVYGVSALPADGSRIAAVSGDGRQVLLETFDPVCADGCTCFSGPPPTVETDESDDSGLVQHQFGYVLLDSVSRTARLVIEPVPLPVCAPAGFRREVSFTRDGLGIWVTETWFTDDGWHAERVRLGKVDIGTGDWTSIVDRTIDSVDVSAATSPSLWQASVVELGDGRIVVNAVDRTWLATPAGEPIRELADTGTPCHLTGDWDGEHVLARCVVPTEAYALPSGVPADQCHPAGLWLIALDGSPVRQLAVSLYEGALNCWASYTSAARFDGELAVQVAGDGATEGVALISADGEVTPWMPPDLADSFTEQLLGVRNGAWVVTAQNESGDSGVYEVTGESTTRIELPLGRIIVL